VPRSLDGQHHVLADKLHRQLAAAEQLHPQAELGGTAGIPSRATLASGSSLTGL